MEEKKANRCKSKSSTSEPDEQRKKNWQIFYLHGQCGIECWELSPLKARMYQPPRAPYPKPLTSLPVSTEEIHQNPPKNCRDPQIPKTNATTTSLTLQCRCPTFTRKLTKYSQLRVQTREVEVRIFLNPLLITHDPKNYNETQKNRSLTLSIVRIIERVGEWGLRPLKLRTHNSNAFAVKLLWLCFKGVLHLGCVPGDLRRNSEEIWKKGKKT